ncbi:MAG: DNA topoisomerase 3 [Betaproteobacteria bacterium]|nr:DNA topoisomerase 3 [Betaproteobacteria bacterium]
MKLVIAEKPSLAKVIREAVGKEYTVTNAFGHIYEQDEPDDYLPDDVPRNAKTGKKVWREQDLPIIPEVWKKHAKKDAKEQIGKIRELLKEAAVVVNAGDPDREGQLLIDEILEELHYNGPVERVWLQSLTLESIRESFRKLKPNSEYKPLCDAATARSRADWLVGMNLTRAWSIRNNGLISVGRVQTPTLALIVRRDLEIEAFKPRDYFEVHAALRHHNGPFAAKWKPGATDVPGFDEEGRLTDKALAERIAAKASGGGVIAEYKADAKKRSAPLPYSLSELQKAASSRLGLGAQAVLDVAQELYEGQYTTYPRTDCRYLAEDQLDGVYGAAAGLAGGLNVRISKVKHAAFNDGKVTAHTAIVPTGKDASNLTGPQAKVYDMIARASVALFMPAEEYLSISAEVDLGGERWAAKGRRVLNPGWRALYGEAADDDEEGGESLPDMRAGDPVLGQGADVKALQTKPPARFTEGTLIDAMANIHRHIEDPAAKAKLKETSGIGTEATRANVIETLFARKFIEKKGKSVISTSVGRAVVKALPAELTDPVTTARWEDHLANIAAGKLDRARFEGAIAQFVREQLALVKQSAGTTAGKGVGAP